MRGRRVFGAGGSLLLAVSLVTACESSGEGCNADQLRADLAARKDVTVPIACAQQIGPRITVGDQMVDIPRPGEGAGVAGAGSVTVENRGGQLVVRWNLPPEGSLTSGQGYA